MTASVELSLKEGRKGTKKTKTKIFRLHPKNAKKGLNNRLPISFPHLLRKNTPKLRKIMSILDRDQCPASSFVNNNDLDAPGGKNPGLA